jgi:hypothetical protein
MGTELDNEALYYLTERRQGLLKQLQTFVYLQRDQISLLGSQPAMLAEALRGVPPQMEAILASLIDIDMQLKSAEQTLHLRYVGQGS